LGQSLIYPRARHNWHRYTVDGFANVIGSFLQGITHLLVDLVHALLQVVMSLGNGMPCLIPSLDKSPMGIAMSSADDPELLVKRTKIRSIPHMHRACSHEPKDQQGQEDQE
jgi:hypothetical protein